MKLGYSHRDHVDPVRPFAPLYYGVSEEFVTVGERKRRYLVYIPKDAMASTAGLLLLPADGRTAEQVLEESVWKHLADGEPCQEKLILCVLEPESGGAWHTDEPYGRPEGDVAYVEAVFQDICRRNRFCIHEAKYYMAGVREGAVIAQKAVLAHPSVYAGLACIGGGGVEAAYRTAADTDIALDLCGFEDPTARQGIRKGDIPVPVWMIAEETPDEVWRDTLDGWRAHCGAAGAPQRRDRNTVCFVRAADTPYPDNQDKRAYRVWSSCLPCAGEADGSSVAQRVWKDFLYGVRRWMADPGGSLRLTQDPVRDLGMEYHYEPVGGWMREWYVYCPETVRQMLDRPAPVVVAMHGYTCSGEIYIGNSGWHEVADRYGFLVVFPTAVFDTIEGGRENKAAKKENIDLPAWNLFAKPDRPDEIAFFRHMLDDLRIRYAVDDARIYATGHSMGSLMTQLLAMACPETFAAVAPCSGVLFEELGDRLLTHPAIQQSPAADLPIWMFVGEQEPWLFPHLPAGDNKPAETIRLWWRRNHMPGAAPQDFTGGWTVYQDRWHDLVYRKDETPMLRYTWVDYLPHATMPEMSFRIWEAFFAHWSRGADGKAVWTD